jgi:beta-N-acetylhexosaminidase
VPVDPRVRELSLSCLLAGFVGPRPPDWLARGLAEGVGGVVLFGSNVGDGTDVRALTDRLREAAGRDVVVALDEEGGDVTRLDTVRGSAAPGAAALGHLDDVWVTEETYAGIGARLRDAGVTVDLAPVADVNSDPRNPVIGVRSFGVEPAPVARHVAAAVRGVQRAGVAACAKHFPGHGATVADSHHEVARVDADRARLDAVDLPPFAAAVGAGTRAVMTGHLLVPALDGDRLVTVSPAVTTGLLRDELGFDGTVISDALEKRALADTTGMAGGFVGALAAGADAIEWGAGEYPDLLDEIPLAVQAALDAGWLTAARLEDAARRTAALARWAPTGPPADRKAIELAPARCLEVVGPLPRLERPLVVEARPPGGMASGELPWSLAEPLARCLPDVEAVAITGADGLDALADRASGRALVVVVRDPHRHPWQRALVDLAGRHPGAVLVDVGWPAPDLPAPLVRTRGVAPGLMVAAARLLAED